VVRKRGREIHHSQYWAVFKLDSGALFWWLSAGKVRVTNKKMPAGKAGTTQDRAKRREYLVGVPSMGWAHLTAIGHIGCSYRR
jgi:hypothetical protein